MISRAHLVALWLVACAMMVVGGMYWRWSTLVADQERIGASAYRIVSQRADQHDAHMTGLSALALAAEPPSIDALRQVAKSIMQFYPRITAIDLLHLDPKRPAVVMTTRDESAASNVDIIRQTAKHGRSVPEMVQTGHDMGRYLLIKRVPNNSDARYALALEIDAARLTDDEAVTASRSHRQLLMPDGTELRNAGNATFAPVWLPNLPLAFVKPLGSASQPLVLDIRRGVPLFDLVPWGLIGLFAVASGVALATYRSYHLARLAARDALARVAFREQEVRLAHASRVNAMGELALGIAHELAQPLAAMLSQSQAGLRMAGNVEMDRAAVTEVLEANARHAKRAGEILGRLRNWVSKGPGVVEHVDLNRVVRDVVALTAADLATRGVTTAMVLCDPAPTVLADHVELEQIAYNLMTNAADASRPSFGRLVPIHVRTSVESGQVRLDVRDEGAGVPPASMTRLFEPFFTSKPNGMGLGLALCQRLAVKFGGEIRVVNHTDGGAMFSLVLPAYGTVACPIASSACPKVAE